MFHSIKSSLRFQTGSMSGNQTITMLQQITNLCLVVINLFMFSKKLIQVINNTFTVNCLLNFFNFIQIWAILMLRTPITVFSIIFTKMRLVPTQAPSSAWSNHKGSDSTGQMTSPTCWLSTCGLPAQGNLRDAQHYPKKIKKS